MIFSKHIQEGGQLDTVMLGVARALPNSNLKKLCFRDSVGIQKQEMEALCNGLEKNRTLQSLHFVLVSTSMHSIPMGTVN